MVRSCEPNIERLIAAFRREKLDRIPNFEEVIGPRTVQHVLGKQGLHNFTLSPPDAVELIRRTDQDAVMTSCGAVPQVEGGLICSPEDIERWYPEPPAVSRASLLPFVEAIEGTSIGLCVGLFAPFFSSFMAMGPTPIQDLLQNLYEDLPFVEALMDKQLEMQMKIVETIADLPISFFFLADDTCDANGYMCSQVLMEEIWVLRMERLVRLVQQKGVPIQYHCCGKCD